MPKGTPVLALALLYGALPPAQVSGQTADAVAAAVGNRYFSAVAQKDLAVPRELHDRDAS